MDPTTNKNLKAGKFEPGMSAPNIKEKSGGAAQFKEGEIKENPRESEVIMEGFIGLPKDEKDKMALQAYSQQEEMTFKSGVEYDEDEDCSSGSYGGY